MTEPADQSARILVIEDEALVARDIQSRLKQLGHEVLGMAHSPRQALELAEELKPDLLLCDIHLKDEIDGIEVSSRITAERDIPVIFLTAYSDRETVTRAKSLTPYGYVLKPIETADLQIAIEMALHKFAVEQELRGTRQLLATALKCIGEALVLVDADHRITEMNGQAAAIFGLAPEEARGLDCEQLLEERAGAQQAASLSWGTLLDKRAVTRLPPFQVRQRDGGQLLVDGVVGPTQEDVARGGMQAGGSVLILRVLAELKESAENLPLPGNLPDGRLAGLFDYPLDHEHAFVLLLISPDDPEALMADLDDTACNRLRREFVEQLNLAMRGSDLASYYGGNVFSASLPFTSLEEANSIGGAILQRLAQHRFLDNSIRLTVSIGISHHRTEGTGSGESPLELFRRAHRALDLARQSGGNRLAIWRPSTDFGLVGNLDSQSELLAADAGQDYRNMALLWNTMSDAGSEDSRGQANSLLGRLQRCFELSKVVLFNWRDGQPRSLAALPDCTEGEAQALLQTCPDLNQTLADSSPLQDGNRWWVPVSFGSSAGGGEGLLFLDAGGARGQLRQQDLLLMQSLVAYLGGPGGERRASPPAASVIGDTRSELLYQSDVMMEVMELIRLVAPTDETVLITGESGTGKELIASEIHRLSPRADGPFVIVDCGAVVSTLIERELFGHVRGAFTGATQNAPGKLKEADGGTLLLDEIGELPLDVQVKLLRVVQDKQFTAVGSTQTETVNTRIIAATNVDLEEDIRQGRFREDLFYRLNVFNIHSPPLRQRDGDVQFLANHFLHSCASQYNRDIRGFTDAAETALRNYPWPGNVRELRNKLIRAVILSQGTEIDIAELDLPAELADVQPSPISTAPHPAVPDQGSLVEVETSLRDALAEQLSYCLDHDILLPLSQWLEQDLILAALEIHGQINLQAAAALNIPESTLRRKLARYQAATESRPNEGQARWQAVVALLPQWVSIARREKLDPVGHVQNLLLTLINERARNQAEAAALAGVSPPTYRRQLSQLADW